MRRVATALFSMLVLVAATTGIASATDEEKFDNLIAKYAPQYLVDITPDRFNRRAPACARLDKPSSQAYSCGFLTWSTVDSLLSTRTVSSLGLPSVQWTTSCSSSKANERLHASLSGSTA